MFASRIIGYLLLAILAGSVIVSLAILGIQWVRSDQGRTVPVPKSGAVLYYEAPASFGITYHSPPNSISEA